MSVQPVESLPRKWLILALVLAAECMDLFDSTIVNVAAPTIREDLNASATALQWITGGYALTFAIGLITGARLGDIYGRKRLFIMGAYGFVLASLACALAPNAELLITFRLIQGFAAALLIPQGLGIMRATFSPKDLPTAFGIFGPVIGLSAVLGPILGGVLVDADLFGTSWRLVFLINLPLGIVAALGAAKYFPESVDENPPSLDIVGTILVAAFAGLLIYPLIQGREYGWPFWTYAMMLASAVSFGLLVLWTISRQRRHKDPLVVPSIFAHRGYSFGLVMILVFFAGMIGTMLTLTLFLQIGQGFSAIHAGLTLAPFAFGMAVGAGVGSGVLVPKLGRTALQIGGLIGGVGMAWMWLTVHNNGLHTSSVDLIGPQLVWGIGTGMIVAPLFDFILAAVTDEETGSASGVLNAVQQLAGAIGVAVLGTIFFSRVGHYGFVSAMEVCFLIELCLTPVLLGLSAMLPQHARDPMAEFEHDVHQPAEGEPAKFKA
ncbi:drug resistance transporter, EmrB/QacA subfamily [Frankineae bacterium MT45]|nr:drug resistance transporter, EmrB/QacA subfamily [Frankineae bacterium MT45]